MNLEQYKNADLSILTSRQQEIFIFALQKKTRKEIAEICGCSVSNVSEIIRKACKKLDNPIFCRYTKIKKHKSQKPRSIDYNKYIGADISALTQREKEIFLLNC